MKRVPKKYRELLPAHAVEFLEDDMENGEEFTFRFVHGTVRVCTKGWEDERESHQWYYRGRRIEYYEDHTYDPWAVGFGTRAPTFESLREAKAYIDKSIEEQEVK